jgi:hypothetical protein
MGTKLPAAGGFLPKTGGEVCETAEKIGLPAEFSAGIRFA